MAWDSRRDKLVGIVGVVSVLGVGAGFAIYQLTRVLFSVVRDSEYEASRLIAAVTATIQSDSPDVDVPEELVIYDDIEEVYTYGSLQELFYRRSHGGDTDWEWSFDQDEWYSTADLAPNHTFILDPPSIIFITRLHLVGVARRKVAAAAGIAGTIGAGSGGLSKHPTRIPPPVELPDWAQQQLQQHTQAAGSAAGPGLAAAAAAAAAAGAGVGSLPTTGCSSSTPSAAAADAGSSHADASSSGAGAGVRRLEDAPDLLTCPITGQIMLQPVTLPSGKTFEYEAVRRWITQHGTDPTNLTPCSILDLHPNLVVREMVERWLQGLDPLADDAADDTINSVADADASTSGDSDGSDADDGGAGGFGAGQGCFGSAERGSQQSSSAAAVAGGSSRDIAGAILGLPPEAGSSSSSSSGTGVQKQRQQHHHPWQDSSTAV